MNFFTSSEVAAIFKVKETTVREWVRAGKLGASYLAGNKSLRISEKDLNSFYENNRMRKEGNHEPQ